ILKGLRGVLDGSYQGSPEAGAKMLTEGMQRFMDLPERSLPDVLTPLQRRADRLRQRLLEARGDMLRKAAEGEPIPAKVARTGRYVEASMPVYFATPIVSRISGFNAALAGRLRRYELAVKQRIARDLTVAKRYFDGVSRMKGEDGALLQQALLNGDRDLIDALNDAYGLTAEYAATVALFDQLRSDLRATGLDVGFIPNYWPRKILDLDGLMMHYYGTPAAGIVQQAL